MRFKLKSETNFPEWEFKKLGEIGEIVNGLTYNPNDIDENGVLVLRSSNVQNRSLVFTDNVFVKTINYNSVKEDDILICVRNGSKNLIGKNALIKKENAGLAFGAFMSIYRSPFNKFLFHWFDTNEYREIIYKNLGATINSINGSDLKNFKVPFPSFLEQQKIASFLTRIDKRIATQNKIIEELNVLKTTVTKRIFSKQLRFKDEDGNDFLEWKNMKLGDIGEVKMCRRIFNDETSLTGEIPFFKIGSFGKVADAFISKELYVDYRNRFSFPKKGDILISAAGTIGRTVVYKGEDAYYQDSNIVWIDNNNTIVINEFLYYILQIVKYNTEGGTIQRLYNNILKSTKFDCPTLPEQQKITNFLSSIDSKIDIENQILQKLEEQKKFLLHQMFV